MGENKSDKNKGFSSFFESIGRWFKSLFVSVDNEEAKIKVLVKKEGTKSFFASVCSIIAGLLIGVVILLIVGLVKGEFNDMLRGILILFVGPFYTGNSANIALGFNAASFDELIFRATPVLLTGLSVAVAFKTGLFNIGAPGQYLMGTMTTLLVALGIPSTPETAFWIWLLALIAGMAAGAVWGVIPGLFKAFLNINEVITCIMTNWIAANLVSWVFDGLPNMKNIEEGKLSFLHKTTFNGISTPKLGLDLIFDNPRSDGGFLIAIVVAIVIFIVINKTTFGYELRATGLNKDAAKYAGMHEKRNIVLSFIIAGALSGMGAALYYLNGGTEFAWETSTALPSEGFNGIPIALLACNNPIGVIFSSVFLAAINISGVNLRAFANYNEYIADLIVAVIIYFSGFANLLRFLLGRKKKNEKTTALIEIKKQNLPAGGNPSDKNDIKEE